MALNPPTIDEIRDSIVSQIEASIGQTVPLLPKAFIRVLAKVLAAVILVLYKYGGFIFLQIFVSTASAQPTEINGRVVTPLNEWGNLVGLGPPNPGTRAELTIDVTVTNQTGTLPAGSQLTNVDNGVTYITLSAVTLNAPTVSVNIRARADQAGGGGIGAVGNLDPGDFVLFVNPLPNVQQQAVVTAQVVTGADPQSADSYRQQVLDRFQKRPQGGAYADYELWGEEPAGILNVYPYTGAPGEVDVYVEATEASSGSPDGIPTAAQLQEVAASIEFDQAGLASRRPANAFVNVYAITRSAFTVEIAGLSVDNAAAVQADITVAVEQYFQDAAPFIPGLSVLPRTDIISRSAVAGIISSVVSAAGGFFTTVTIEGPSLATVELYTLGEGEKAKADSVTFV